MVLNKEGCAQCKFNNDFRKKELEEQEIHKEIWCNDCIKQDRLVGAIGYVIEYEFEKIRKIISEFEKNRQKESSWSFTQTLIEIIGFVCIYYLLRMIK